MKVLAKANIDGKIIDCKGFVSIEWKNEHQAYVSWEIISPTTTIVSRSENIHCKNSDFIREELNNKIKERILSYRIDRKKVFNEIDFIDF